MSEFTKQEIETMKKYGIKKGTVICQCGKPATINAQCWRCYSIKVNGIDRTDWLAKYEIKYRQ